MKTDALIAMLASDTLPRARVGQRLGRALAPALALGVLALVTLWQVRVDLAAALASFAVSKTLLPAGLALLALWLVRGLADPLGRARAPLVLVLAAGAAALAAVVWGVVQGGTFALTMHAGKPTLLTCILSIPTLAALPLAAILWALRLGAPMSAPGAGAAAGLAAGALGAMVYSLHCPEDAMLFFVPAYGTMILVVTGIGTFLGARLLRW